MQKFLGKEFIRRLAGDIYYYSMTTCNIGMLLLMEHQPYLNNVLTKHGGMRG